MALPIEKLRTRYAERTETIDPERAKAYAAATNDDNPAYESGKFAPPVFGVVPTWDALGLAAADVIPPEAFAFVVHGEQDMHFHQPLVPGMTLVSYAEAYSVRVGRSGTRYTVRIVSNDTDAKPVLEIFSTTFIRGMSDGESGGPDKPDHSMPRDLGEPVATFTVHVDDDQTYRYRDASGDTMPIHVDDDFAKSVGLPGIIVHGLCTMAMCSQAVVKTVAGGDPSRLRRLAVRFSKPVIPGNDVVTSIYDIGNGSYAFEASSGGATVIKDGRAEVAPASRG
jgi:acyl dehydratase